jgi:hypothetical protein
VPSIFQWLYICICTLLLLLFFSSSYNYLLKYTDGWLRHEWMWICVSFICRYTVLWFILVLRLFVACMVIYNCVRLKLWKKCRRLVAFMCIPEIKP